MIDNVLSVYGVFATEALEGNALAVFPNGSGLDETTMQRIARELKKLPLCFYPHPIPESAAAKIGAGLFTKPFA
jgi:predicted PhzF superfamily epimerase YddE/YHI9